MSNTYTWTVTNLTGYPVFDGQTDVVTTAYCTVVADDGQGHTASIRVIQPTPLDPEAPFIPYDELTNDIVVGWVQNGLGQSGVVSIMAALDGDIAAQINPPLTPQSFPLPWGSATGTVSDYVPPGPPVVEVAVPIQEVSSGESLISAPATLRAEQIVDPFLLPTSDVPPSVDGMTNTILG